MTVRIVASKPSISTEVHFIEKHITRLSEIKISVTIIRRDITLLKTWLLLDINVRTLNRLYKYTGLKFYIEWGRTTRVKTRGQRVKNFLFSESGK